MRKIIVQAEVSLDMVQDSPALWPKLFEYHNEEIENNYMKGKLFASGGLLMGRETYADWAVTWPSRAGANEFADKMNSMPKFVASRTLKAPLTWNATLIQGDVPGEIARLKQQPGGDLLQYGFSELTHTLLQHGLVDELHFLTFPFVLGSGKRTFENVESPPLTLLETRSFDTGVVALHYQVQKQK